jgi:hypothetical protein
MRKQQDGAFVVAPKPFQQTDELSRLRTAVFIAGKHIRKNVKYGQVRLPFRQIGVKRMIHRCWLDLPFRERA